ncbi:ketohexokinase-like [Saccostrea echinata]|uniref:ketohexokinase-like n=1 Tax=Saccostrea echinata TaxID=191078 RepID=UPI002A7F1956|nr:ketohexokinase-like [Saccostrea echinata]
MSGPRVMCVGLACVDIINVCKNYPEEDSDQRVLDFYWQRGGNASNTSSVLSLLGAQSEYMGSFANDNEMRFLKEDFDSFGVSTSHCRTYSTGYITPTSVIIVNSQNGSRTILHASKNLPEITLEDFKAVDLKNYKWIHFEGRPSFNTPAYEIVRMLAHIDEYNRSVSESEQVQTSVELEKPARPELDQLLDKAKYVFVSKDYSQNQGLRSKEEAVKGFIKRCRKGASVICAWGEDGAAATDAEGQLITSPCFPPERLCDTLAAGDTFNAATILTLAEGRNLTEAITFGCKVAGAKCGMQGIRGLKDIKFT